MTNATVAAWFQVLDQRNRQPDPAPAGPIARDLRVNWDDYTDAAVKATAERNNAPLPHHSSTVFMQHFGYYNMDAMMQPLWGVRGVLGPRAADARRRMYQALQREETRFRVMLIGRVLCGRIRARLLAPPAPDRDAVQTWFAMGLCLAAIGETRLGRVKHAFDIMMALAAGQRYATADPSSMLDQSFIERAKPKPGLTAASAFRSTVAAVPPGTWDIFCIARRSFIGIHPTARTACVTMACANPDHRPHPWRIADPLPDIGVIVHHLDLMDFLQEALDLGLTLYATPAPNTRRRPVRVLEITPSGAVRIQFVDTPHRYVLHLHRALASGDQSGTDLTTFRSFIWSETGETPRFMHGPELNLSWMENMRVRHDFSAEVMQEQHKSLEFLSTLRWPAGGRAARAGERPDAGWRDLGDPLRHIQGYLGDGGKIAPATDDRVHVLRTESSSGAAASGEDDERRRKGRVAEAMNIE